MSGAVPSSCTCGRAGLLFSIPSRRQGHSSASATRSITSSRQQDASQQPTSRPVRRASTALGSSFRDACYRLDGAQPRGAGLPPAPALSNWKSKKSIAPNTLSTWVLPFSNPPPPDRRRPFFILNSYPVVILTMCRTCPGLLHLSRSSSSLLLPALSRPYRPGRKNFSDSFCLTLPASAPPPVLPLVQHQVRCRSIQLGQGDGEHVDRDAEMRELLERRQQAREVRARRGRTSDAQTHKNNRSNRNSHP
jgi:hypothetical protein